MRLISVSSAQLLCDDVGNTVTVSGFIKFRNLMGNFAIELFQQLLCSFNFHATFNFVICATATQVATTSSLIVGILCGKVVGDGLTKVANKISGGSGCDVCVFVV